MSDVPLPKPCIKGGEIAEVSEDLWEFDALRAYGDACAAEARRLALLEAIEIADYYEYAETVAAKLRALVDEASRKDA